MTVTYKGLDCIADADSAEYQVLTAESQDMVEWAAQGKYALYCLYFGVVLLTLMVMKKVIYILLDDSSRMRGASGRLNIPLLNKWTAISRWLAYKKIPLIISRITGLPSSIGTLFVFFSSTLYVLCYAFIPHFYYRSCRGFGSPPLAVRTGMMALSFTPFLVIMSGKTNFISGITGISYEKLNCLHQFLGWGTLFLSLVHAIPFLLQDVKEGGMSRLHETWDTNITYQNGVAPLVLLFLMCVCGTRFVRRNFYEIFWQSHWIMGLIYFGLLAWHIYDQMGIEYIWGTIGFWGAQTFYRVVAKSTFKPNIYAFKHKEATVKSFTHDFFEISIPIKSHYEFFWRPGQHIYIRFMNGIHTLENHPFSIVTVPRNYGETNLKLIVKPQKGLTRKIYENVLNESNLEKKYKIYIDGPYGGMNRDPLSFDKLILISTGSGVTVTLSFVMHVIQNLACTTNCVQMVDFNWVIREVDSIELIEPQLIEIFNTIIKINPKLLSFFDFNIFITNSSTSKETEIITNRKQLPKSRFDELSEKELLNESSDIDHTFVWERKVDKDNYRDFLNIRFNSKPSFEHFLSETSLLGKNAVIVSGSQTAQIDTANAVSDLQKRVSGEKNKIQEVYLHTENFGW